MTAPPNQAQPDGAAGDPPPGNGAPGTDGSGDGRQSRPPSGAPREDEVSLLDILLVLARNKTLIVRTVLVFTAAQDYFLVSLRALLGVTYAILAPEEFTSEARVVREAQQESGGLPSGIPSGAFSGLGINLGGASSGLAPTAYPDVLRSLEV